VSLKLPSVLKLKMSHNKNFRRVSSSYPDVLIFKLSRLT
jgi:hypothetical protein